MSRNRPWIDTDHVGHPCSCLECQMAGVTHLPSIHVPRDEFHVKARWLHGDELKAYYAAKDAALTSLAELRKRLTSTSTHGGEQ